jgi:nicotinamide-nucleotide amidase
LKASILAVGSELLTPQRADTNALFVTRKLLEVGIEVVLRQTVADELALLTAAFRHALERSQLVIATGGLGPTEDDLTREAAAAALGRGMTRDGAYLAALKERFARYGRAMAPVNEKQADRIDGAQLILNPRGTAPGQSVATEAGQLLVLLPGPPIEMEPMFESQVLPLVRARAKGAVLKTRVLRIASMGESEVEQVVAPIYKAFANPRTTILSAPGQVELHLVAEARSDADAESLIESLAAPIRQALTGRIYSEDGRELAEVVAALLKERKLTIAVAESCTGGLLSARLTELPGASAFFDRALVTYSNEAKVELLSVPAPLIAERGAVDEEVARAMAEGARRSARASIGVGITGVAGPDGGSPEKPVGLVYIALAGAAGERVRRAHFPGERERVRFQATQAALEMIRRGLLGQVAL